MDVESGDGMGWRLRGKVGRLVGFVLCEIVVGSKAL